jgi:carboxyl-terminal processing protease
LPKHLQKNDAIFNYVTNYYYKNPSLGDKIPTLTDADFADFKSIFKKENFSFDTETELALKTTLEKAKKEKIDATIKAEYQQFIDRFAKKRRNSID